MEVLAIAQPAMIVAPSGLLGVFCAANPASDFAR
jgi:hypothetical protein